MLDVDVAITDIDRRGCVGQSSDAARHAISPLSIRERQVLERMSDGGTNKQIARSLCLAENTVKFHLKNIHAKLGAQRRTEAVRIARDHGLLTSGPVEVVHSKVVSRRTRRRRVPSGVAGSCPARAPE
jgi:DNA-binding CsgD family transcriptional regulator